MADMNQCNFTGRIGGLELRYIPNGSAIMQFSVAIGESRKDDSGQWIDKTTWVRCEAWGGSAEYMDRNAQKGTQVRITAKVEVKEWEDKQTGQKRSSTIFKAKEIQIIGNRKESNSNQTGSQQPERQPQQPKQPQAPLQQNEPPMDWDDNIPFAPIGLPYPRHAIYVI
ncbi:single-stranded DNA-binding protein [Providencia sp. PROV132]|uniref:single-stranded DNA-binding protein n=1 Tax=Providencia sp. PROV132 TaxID=2949842 RepID=UPI002349E4CB|nr:single-stranded DNA-binding protein [Providencia sp. PROV132]